MNLKSTTIKTLSALFLIVGALSMAPNAKASGDDSDDSAPAPKNCLAIFQKVCLGGGPLVILPGQIVDALDTVRYCSSTPITCAPAKCSKRLNVLFAFAAPRKPGACLPL